MSRPPVYYSKSDFSQWLYEQMVPVFDGNTDVQDIDFVIFNYLTGDLMTIEAKERNGRSLDAQKDTQNVLRQLLMLGSEGTVNTKRGVRAVKYHGHHLVQFENSTPDNGRVRLDGTLVGREQFMKFLNFGQVKETNP